MKTTGKFKFYGIAATALMAVAPLATPMVTLVAADQTTNETQSQQETTSPDNTTQKGSDVELDTKVDSTKLDAAVKAATDAGVKVTKGNDDQVTVDKNTQDEVDKRKSKIASDYASQVKSLEEVTKQQQQDNEEYKDKTADYQKQWDKYDSDEAQWKKDYAAYEEALKNPEIDNSSTFTEDQLKNFLGDNISNVSYVTSGKTYDGQKLSASLVKGTPLSQDQINTLMAKSTLTDLAYAPAAGINKDEAKQLHDDASQIEVVTKPDIGTAMRYDNAFTLQGTKQNVDVVMTLSSYNISGGRDESYIRWIKGNIGATIWHNGYDNAKFTLDFYKHGTDEKINGNLLFAVGDIDWDQYLEVDSAYESSLIGNKLTTSKTDTGLHVQSGSEGAQNEDTTNQAWFVMKNSSQIKFGFGTAPVTPVNYTQYTDTRFDVGNIAFAMKLPDKPVEPEKPTIEKPTQKNEATTYHLTKLNLMPTPDPDKKVENKEGVDIDGKTVLPGSEIDYVLKWNTSAFKDLNATEEQVKKGFGFIEDIPDDAVDVDLSKFKYETTDGKTVNDIKATSYKTLNEAPSEVQAMVKSSEKTPKGAFIYFAVSDPQAFYETHVKKGVDINMHLPMTVKEKLTDSFENVAYEIDFGNGYNTEIVKNEVPKIAPKKDVVKSDTDSTSLNDKEIALNSTLDYELIGSILPKGLAEVPSHYGLKDDIDEKHDQYDGKYKTRLSVDVVLKDGTTLNKGTDITDKTKQVLDKATAKTDIEVNPDFLKEVDYEKSEFGVNAYPEVKRIATGDVFNVYTNLVGDGDYSSNKVHTFTPAPKGTPKTTKPVEKEDNTVISKTPAQNLPQTDGGYGNKFLDWLFNLI